MVIENTYRLRAEGVSPAKAAMEGVPTAMHMVGYCYMKGIGTEKDEREAGKWLKMAEDNGVEEASEMLAMLGSVLG